MTAPARATATRIEDACVIESCAYFDTVQRLKSLYADVRGTYRVFPRPILREEAERTPSGSLFIWALPLTYKTSVGQAGSPTEYRLTFQFVLPLAALDRLVGHDGWHDDIRQLISWLYRGGSHPNIPGNLFDPDYPTRSERQFLTTSIIGFQVTDLGAFTNQSMIAQLIMDFQVVEDSQGNKI